MDYFEEARKVALKATCKRARCGTVIVKDGTIIASGFNSPAGNLENQRRCAADKQALHKKITDKTCCIHAEQRAILDALKKGVNLEGSTLYFTRINDCGEIEFSGKPYCTICSKLALESGVKEWVLLHKDGPKVYDAAEYNLESYKYTE